MRQLFASLLAAAVKTSLEEKIWLLEAVAEGWAASADDARRHVVAAVTERLLTVRCCQCKDWLLAPVN
jgi:hypothetical protein